MNPGDSMRAIVQDRYGTTEVLSHTDIRRPVPEAGEVLVRVHAAGVDPGIWHLMTGLPYATRLFGFGVRKPKNPVRGLDFAGVVVSGGTRFEPGAEVFGTCAGAFAEYATAREQDIALKPAHLSFAEAAIVPGSAFAALQGLRDKGSVAAGQKVLVIGAGGGVGSFAVQLAKVFQAEVTGVCSTAKVEFVASLGADHVLDYTRDRFPTAGEYDLILDVAGNRPLSVLRRALAPRGTLVIAGGESSKGRWLQGTDRNLRAMMLSPFVRQRLCGLISVGNQQDLLFLSGLIATGKLRPTLDQTFPLAKVSHAMGYVAEGRSHGKVAVIV